MKDEAITNRRSWKVLDRYIDHLAIDKSQTTLDIYRRRIELFITFVEKRIGSVFGADTIKRVDGEAIQDFYIFLQDGRGIATINQYVICIRHFLRHLNGLGWIEDSQLTKYVNMLPMARVRKYRRDDVKGGNRVAFSYDELEKLFNAPRGYLRARNQAIIAMMAGSGLRAFEICSLTIGDCRLRNQGKICVVECIRKGSRGKKRIVEIADFVTGYIDEYLASRPDAKDTDPLFVTKYNTPMNPNSLWCMLAEVMRSAGLPTGTHNLRRTFLTNIDRVGGVAIARDAGGHTSINTTDVYLRPTAGDIRTAIDNLPYKGVFEKNFKKEGPL